MTTEKGKSLYDEVADLRDEVTGLREELDTLRARVILPTSDDAMPDGGDEPATEGFGEAGGGEPVKRVQKEQDNAFLIQSVQEFLRRQAEGAGHPSIPTWSDRPPEQEPPGFNESDRPVEDWPLGIPPPWGTFGPVCYALITAPPWPGTHGPGWIYAAGQIFMDTNGGGVDDGAPRSTSPYYLTDRASPVTIFCPCGSLAGDSGDQILPFMHAFDATHESWMAVVPFRYPKPDAFGSGSFVYETILDAGLVPDGTTAHFTRTASNPAPTTVTWMPLTLRIRYTDTDGISRWLWTRSTGDAFMDITGGALKVYLEGDGSGWYNHRDDSFDITFTYPPQKYTTVSAVGIKFGTADYRWISIQTLQFLEGIAEAASEVQGAIGTWLGFDSTGRLAHGVPQSPLYSVDLGLGVFIYFDSAGHYVPM